MIRKAILVLHGLALAAILGLWIYSSFSPILWTRLGPRRHVANLTRGRTRYMNDSMTLGIDGHVLSIMHERPLPKNHEESLRFRWVVSGFGLAGLILPGAISKRHLACWIPLPVPMLFLFPCIRPYISSAEGEADVWSSAANEACV